MPSNRQQWAMILASYLRANDWAGVGTCPAHGAKMATVSSTTLGTSLHGVAATGELLLRFSPPTRAQPAGVSEQHSVQCVSATETDGFAAKCDRHRGMHVFEDLVRAIQHGTMADSARAFKPLDKPWVERPRSTGTPPGGQRLPVWRV